MRREILAVSQVQSQRVPRILATGQVAADIGNCVWIREERVMGTTVRDQLRSGPLSPHPLLRLGLHMLEALVQAERAHIVHRDLKPDTMMCDHDGNFWLLDFGVARHLELDSLTATAAPFGKFTPGYAPPEQFRNLKAAIDTRADLFALGVTLYECSTGANPFITGNALYALRNVERLPLPALSLPIANANDFRDLVAAMTQKRRDHRPSSAAGALEWMAEICQKESVG